MSKSAQSPRVLSLPKNSAKSPVFSNSVAKWVRAQGSMAGQHSGKLRAAIAELIPSADGAVLDDLMASIGSATDMVRPIILSPGPRLPMVLAFQYLGPVQGGYREIETEFIAATECGLFAAGRQVGHLSQKRNRQRAEPLLDWVGRFFADPDRMNIELLLEPVFAPKLLDLAAADYMVRAQVHHIAGYIAELAALIAAPVLEEMLARERDQRGSGGASQSFTAELTAEEALAAAFGVVMEYAGSQINPSLLTQIEILRNHLSACCAHEGCPIDVTRLNWRRGGNAAPRWPMDEFGQDPARVRRLAVWRGQALKCFPVFASMIERSDPTMSEVRAAIDNGDALLPVISRLYDMPIPVIRMLNKYMTDTAVAGIDRTTSASMKEIALWLSVTPPEWLPKDVDGWDRYGQAMNVLSSFSDYWKLDFSKLVRSTGGRFNAPGLDMAEYSKLQFIAKHLGSTLLDISGLSDSPVYPKQNQISSAVRMVVDPRTYQQALSWSKRYYNRVVRDAGRTLHDERVGMRWKPRVIVGGPEAGSNDNGPASDAEQKWCLIRSTLNNGWRNLPLVTLTELMRITMGQGPGRDS